jgi:class 3 adenylate cyclase
MGLIPFFNGLLGCYAVMESKNEACGRCGASLVVAGAGFCHACGAPARPARADPRAYTPRHLVEKILVSRSALEGERKIVTVLFADVKESMALAEHVDPETWHGILDRFFAILADGVHRFEGTINQFTGDGIMALFGAPLAHEDHAQRACLAALGLQDDLRRYANELRLERGLNFSVRMGISSGMVVVGKIGDDLRMDYTAQGHTVGLAARMQQIAEAGRVYLTGETAELVEGELELSDLGSMQLKGASEPVRVYVLEGIGPAATRLDRSRARGLARLVGRDEELAALASALEKAKRGQAQVVGVVGPAGVGKSRLCSEFLSRCRADGAVVHEVHCSSHAAAPLATAIDLVRRLLDVGPDDGDRKAREKIAGRLMLLDPMFDEALPSIFAILGVAEAEHPVPLEPEARLRRTSNLLRHLVQMHGGSATTVLAIDDAHSIDAESSAVIADLVELCSGVRFLLLANFRPEHRTAWLDAAHCHRLPLAPLGDDACEDLLDEWLGGDASLAELRSRVRERAQGNPFFLEELIRSCAAAGVVAGGRGAYVLARPLAEPDLPVTVQAVLASRIDRMDEHEKRLLQVAAAIGKEFSLPVLRRVLELCGDEQIGGIDASLRALVRERLVTTGGRGVDIDYAFEHPLTHEVAYQSQLGEARARLHAAVASALEELCADRLGSQAERIAAHWEAAGRRGQALRWRRRAALRVTSIQLGHRGTRFAAGRKESE